MELSSKIVHGKWYWLELVFWYAMCLYAPHAPETFNFKWFVHDFNEEATFKWFLFDFSNILGIFLGFRGLFLFSESRLYKIIGQVIMIDMIYEMLDLIILNNEYNFKSLIFQNIIVITAIIHAVYSHNKK